MHPLAKVKIKWSHNFAYAIGLLTTDGSLSVDGRHINFTSKDKEQIDNFQKCLGVQHKISKKGNGKSREKKYFYVQVGDVLFYNFLLDIGLMPNKTKVLKAVYVPDKYFFDFLRGHLDGDGSFYFYWDKRWRRSFMFYLTFASASQKHLLWLRKQIKFFLGIYGHITSAKNKSCYQLKYAKQDTLKLVDRLYQSEGCVRLNRKYLKMIQAFDIIKTIKSNC